MIPGKKYTLADYEHIAWRRRWLILVPFLVVAIGTVVVVQLLPNRYRSETTILVVPQRVPENLVRSTVSQGIDERLQMISQQILSRTRLERIVQEFNLYEHERKDMIMEDVIEQMRTKDIKVGITSGRTRRDDATAFTVSYESSSARTALLVTERLASLFIKENLDDRSVLAEATTQFLEAQLEDARRRLDEHEKKLAAYRRINEGTLPTQLQANLQAIQTTQQQIRNVQDSMSRDTDRKLTIEGQLAALNIDSAPAPVPTSSGDSAAVTAGTATQRLEAARASLKSMELRLTADHPDMKALKRLIGDLEKAAEQEALQRPISETAQPAAAVSPSEIARRTRVAELQTEHASIDRRLKEGYAELQRLAASTNAYQRRVEATPQRESELTALMRDYETLKDIYTQLLQKNEASKVSANLERRQIGEQFRVLDSARLPEKPISPNRIRLNLMGAVAGLALGIGLVVLFEYRDTTLKSEADVIAALALPVLALVPAIATTKEVVVRRKRRLAISTAGVVLAIGLAGIALWKFHLIEQWVR